MHLGNMKRPLVLAMTIATALGARAATAEYTLYESEERGSSLTVTADFVLAWYNDNDSWFGNSTAFLGANTDDWADVGFEPKLAYERALDKGTLFGEVSGVYTSTQGDDASGLTVGLEDTDAFTLEQGHIGWRAEDVFEGMDGDTVELIIGRHDYNIGTGLLINDGGGDGGERGGFYLGMRKAFSESLIARLDTDTWLFEGFRLKNRPRRGGTQGEAYGANVEYDIGDTATLGGTFMQVDSNVPGQAQADVVSARVSWTLAGGFGVSGEYVDESSSQLEATGYYGKLSYQADESSPEFSYRYAHFDGDDPATLEDERFREIAYGYTDWGSWYQGEITGGYALGNGNVVSHLLRVKMQPDDDMTVNLMYYNFTLDQPASFGVTSDDWGDELNVTLDWTANEHVYVSGIFGILFPGAGAEQYAGLAGGGDDWLHAMLYVSYAW